MSRVTQTEDQIVETFLRETFNDENSNLNSNPTIKSGSSGAINEDDDGTALSADIRKMAQALAPQMSELEDVLKDFSDTEKIDASELADTSRSMMENEDDDLDDELTQLAMSEQALREELEFAAGMSLLGSPGQKMGMDPLEERSDGQDLPEPTVLNTIEEEKQPEACHDSVSTEVPSVYTLQDHADYLKLRTERIGGWYFCDMTSKFLPASSGLKVAEDLVKDYCLPIPFRKLKRLYTGLVFHDVVQHAKRLPAMTPSKGLPNTPVKTSSSEGIPGTPVMPAANTSSSAPVLRTPKTPAESRVQPASGHNVEEPLPVRTVAIRVRPDVLCGAIMDAVHHAFDMLPNNCTTHVLKRQGGHLRGAVYVPDKQVAYVADIQLCTQKNDDLERRLIVRYYHVQDDPDALQELGQSLQRLQQQVPPSPQIVESILRSNSSAPTVNANSSGLSSLTNSTYTVVSATPNGPEADVIAEEKLAANRHMKQACSLIQRLMAAQQQGGIQQMDVTQQKTWLGLRDVAFGSKWAMQRAIGKHLESNFKSCPSVREENKKANPTIRRLTLPSLSGKDWPMLDVSWTLTGHIVEELDTRDCTFSTLSTLPFGQFPSLPTLDVQYCSQLRRLSRENMISQLLKAAKELEDYAAIAEYNCAVCITLLAPNLEFYGVPPLKLPKAKSLDQYPLEYVPPQQACPPWGTLVMESLNVIASKTPTGEIDVAEAVRMVYRAFTKQDDEEQGARLGRKNAQIMERLANMQSHQRALIQNIQDSHVYSQVSAESASNFLKRAQGAFNVGKEGYPSVLREEVPLLEVKISLGASKSGKCYVTASQILFTTTYIPVVGSTTSILFDLKKIDIEVEVNPTSSLLNPFPNTMNVILKSTKEILYSFRPAIGPDRLQTFTNVIQSFVGESSPSEYSQVIHNSQVIDEDGELQLADSEDQLSI